MEDGVPLLEGQDRTNHREVSSPQFASSVSARSEVLLSAEGRSQPARAAYLTVAGPGSPVSPGTGWSLFPCDRGCCLRGGGCRVRAIMGFF